MHKWKLEHVSEPYKYVRKRGGMGKRTANEAKLVQPEMVAAVTCPFCSRNKTPSKRARKAQPKLDAVFTCTFCTGDRSVHRNRAKKPKLGEAERAASGNQEPCVSAAGPSNEDMENESRPIPTSSQQEPCVSPAGPPDESKEKESRRIPASLSPSRRNGSPRRPPLVCASSNQEPCVSSAMPPDETKENESRRVPASFRRRRRKGTPRRAPLL